MSQINTSSGKKYWRSLDELADSPEFKEQVEREFPEGASELDSFSRRGFMKIMAASMTLAGVGGLSSCRRPEEKILPYANAPEGLIPGKANFYATAIPRSSGSIGILAKSHEGRPTKLEGLPTHPSNMGKTDIHAQADILDLYNPFRLQYVKTVENGKVTNMLNEEGGMTAEYRMGINKSWKQLGETLTALNAKHTETKGKGLAILSTAVTSPTEDAVRAELVKKFPATDFFTWEAINEFNSSKAVDLLTQTKGNQVNYKLDKVKTVVSLGNDFMMKGRDHLRLTREFNDARKVFVPKGDEKALADAKMNRLYAIEAGFSLTGSNSDHRYRLQASAMFEFLVALTREVSSLTKIDARLKNYLEGFSPKYDFSADKLQKGDNAKTGADFIKTLAKELVENSKNGKGSAILTGDDQPVAVHVLALLLNNTLGNNGKSLSFTERAAKYSEKSIEALRTSIEEGKVSDLIILNGNPAYDTAADLKIADSLKKVNSIHLTANFNETSALANTVVPKAHFLEAWGDTRAADGTVSLIQPLIAPLFGAVTEAELLAQFAGLENKKAIQLVKATQKLSGEKWEKAVHDSVIAGSANKTLKLSIKANHAIAILNAVEPFKANGFEIVFTTDYSLLDGSYADNGWMQEFPDPITKITWDNAAQMSMETYTGLKLGKSGFRPTDANKENGNNMVEINGQEFAAWIVPGIAKNSVILPLGYGRTTSGPVGRGTGFNAYTLQKSANPLWTNATITNINKNYDLASTQDHWAMEDRELVKDDNIAAFKKTPAMFDNFVDPDGDSVIEDRPEWEKEGSYQWAMTIDLNSCTGCGTCTIACQAENNISVVGKERVLKGREMHWIRMDRYFFSGYDGPGVFTPDYTEHDLEVEGAYHQPVPCMHCEKAPCELVCPVAATAHNDEGLNDMAYNRCIGTRYCGNNCPYKVRRFNFFQYQENFKDKQYEVQKMVHNPNVTVRSRGVMEKCTYCVQRINEAKIDAKVDGGGRLTTDSFTTACAQACPTEAITFGDQNNKETAVAKMQEEQRNYVLLPHLNARPRTSFLARLRNQNPELV